MTAWGAAGGVGRCRWHREGYRRGNGCGRADGSAALTGGSSWAGGRGKKEEQRSRENPA